MALWLQNEVFSAEAKAVLAAGRAVWQLYYALVNCLNSPKFKIATWYAGWWQVRHALAEQNMGTEPLDNLKEKHNILKNKPLPQIYDLGFLS